MKWREAGCGIQAFVGHLFVRIEELEAFKSPGHPDYEPARFAWFIAPDDQDKNYRRALDEGNVATIEDAKRELKEALITILGNLARALERYDIDE